MLVRYAMNFSYICLAYLNSNTFLCYLSLLSFLAFAQNQNGPRYSLCKAEPLLSCYLVDPQWDQGKSITEYRQVKFLAGNARQGSETESAARFTKKRSRSEFFELSLKSIQIDGLR